MMLPLWQITQKRSQKGLRKWCAIVLEGEDRYLAADRLVPVVRIPFLPDWRAGDAHTFSRTDGEYGAWWFQSGTDRWREGLELGTDGLVYIRESEPEPGTGTVGRGFGVFRVERTVLSNDSFHLRVSEQIARMAS